MPKPPDYGRVCIRCTTPVEGPGVTRGGWTYCSEACAEYVVAIWVGQVLREVEPEDIPTGLMLSPNRRLVMSATPGRDAEYVLDRECESCLDGEAFGLCPKSPRKCGHHCNHLETADRCHFCGGVYSDEGGWVPGALNDGGDSNA